MALKMTSNLENQAIMRRVGHCHGEDQPMCPNSIILNATKVTTFGRTAASNVRLLSCKAPHMISRQHASVCFFEGKWAVIDHTSLNGVYVNEEKIMPESPYNLTSGDKICFGAMVEKCYEFEYIFEILVNNDNKRKSDKIESATEPKIRKVLEEAETSGLSSKENSEVCKIIDSERKIEALKTLLAEKEKAYMIQLEQKDKDFAKQISEYKQALDRGREQEKMLRGLLQDEQKHKEEFCQKFEQEKDILLAEKKKVEDSLIEEINCTIDEKDKELTIQLNELRTTLQNALKQKESEKIRLQEELEENRVEREKLQSLEKNEMKLAQDVERLREELAEKQKEINKLKENDLAIRLEDDLTCIICQELFIESTTLSCSHSFCNYCLNSWMKKKHTCPICRTAIKGTPVRSRVLDCAVEKVMETIDDETKSRRVKIIKERKEKAAEISVVDETPPEIQRRIGNHDNPIVVEHHDRNEVQIVERQVPPFFFPHLIFRPERPPPPLQQPGNNQVRRRRAQPQAGIPFPIQNNNRCFHCGMLGHWFENCPFR